MDFMLGLQQTPELVKKAIPVKQRHKGWYSSIPLARLRCIEDDAIKINNKAPSGRGSSAKLLFEDASHMTAAGSLVKFKSKIKIGLPLSHLDQLFTTSRRRRIRK